MDAAILGEFAAGFAYEQSRWARRHLIPDSAWTRPVLGRLRSAAGAAHPTRCGRRLLSYSTGATGIGAMSLPLEDMASAASVVAGCDLALPRDALLIIPRAASMARLQRLHAAAGHLAETAPEVIAHPEAARGLEQALIEAMVDCLTAGDIAEEHAAQRRHELIMRRFYELMEEIPRSATVRPGDLQGDRGCGANISDLLPRATWS